MKKVLTKKTAGWMLLPLLCAALLLAPLAGCANAGSADAARLRPDVSIIIDGVKQVFYNVNGQQVHPILYNGTTYLPVRAVGELMGKNVDWNEETKTVALGGARTAPASSGMPDSKARAQDITVEVRSDFTVVVDGVVRTFADAGGKTVYPVLYNGSTYLPVRAVGELMGKSVAWDSAAGTVTLSGGTVTDADSFSGGTTPSGGNANPPASGQITAGDAQAKALAHADVSASDAVFTKTKLDWEDGRQVYEVEFYNGSMKYEYDVDAKTGEIVSYEQKSGTPTTPSGNMDLITAEDAKAKALAHAGVSASDATFTKTKLDWEDGRQVYEVEFHTTDGMEYDYELDAKTGEVIAFDYEAESHAPASGGAITREKAQEIALGKVPGAAAGHIVKLKLEYDGGVAIYEIEIVYNGMEYEMEIDAATGAVIEFEAEAVRR